MEALMTIYSSPRDGAAVVLGYVHGDGATAVCCAPTAANGIGITMNLHWSPAEAREVAASLLSAADAIDVELAARSGHPAEDAVEGRAAMERSEMSGADTHCTATRRTLEVLAAQVAEQLRQIPPPDPLDTEAFEEWTRERGRNVIAGLQLHLREELIP